MNRAVQLHIRKLVLTGVDPNDTGQVGAAVKQELARLLADQGLPAGLTTSSHRGKLDAGTLEPGHDGTPEGTGHQIARAVYKGISK